MIGPPTLHSQLPFLFPCLGGCWRVCCCAGSAEGPSVSPFLFLFFIIMIFSGASLLLFLLLLFVENVDQMDCVEWETGMVGGWWGDLFISSLESQTFSSTWRFEFDGKKKIFRWSPNRRRRKKLGQYFFFLCLRSISDAARVDTYTRSQEPPPLFALPPYIYIYILSPP